MSAGRYFLDTNIFVYSLAPSEPAKQAVACRLIDEAVKRRSGVVSFQVVQEFVSVATRKFAKPFSPGACREYVSAILLPICDVFPGVDFHMQALDVYERTGLSFHDCLILQAALQAGCDTLYSEDLQDGYKLHGVTVRNPFAAA